MTTSPFCSRRAFCAALLLAALLVFASAAAPARAAWPGRDGSIAFVRGPHIWVQLPDGKQRQLTDEAEGADSEPTFSRNGETIAFVRFEGNSSHIWAMNSDGTDQRRVTGADEGAYESQPAFFPGGLSLVFARRDPISGWSVFSVRLDGHGEELLANGAKNPAVSPNGHMLAFVQTRGRWLRSKDLRSGGERRLPGSWRSQEPDFSPDGRRLVFAAQRGCDARGHRRLSLMTTGLDGGSPGMLLNACRRSFIPYSPVWSPSGARVLFVRRDQPGAVRSTSRLQLLNLRGALVAGAPRHRGGEFSPSWQPLR
jgi:Tol biopolymer transport system component